MIVFLTLVYVAVLFLLVRFGVIRLNTFWKLSPILWMLLLTVVLFIPMQWGAPGGPVRVVQAVVPIVPNVGGTVTEVRAKPLTPMKKGDLLFQIDERPFRYALEQAEASRSKAEAERDLANVEVERNRQAVETSAAAQRDLDAWLARLETAEAAIALAESQIDLARFHLESTSVRAPADGFPIGVISLRPGMRVAKAPVAPSLTYVESEETRVAIGVHQNTARHIRPGQPAEVTFSLFPGRIFQATVESLVPITPEGQLVLSGNVPMMPAPGDRPLPFGAVLALEEDVELPMIPGGAVGTGAIYTDIAVMTQIIRRVMIRMDMWLNYVLPS